MGLVQIELTEKDLTRLIKEYLGKILGDIPINEQNISIQVKSKQNYKSEWETAAFKATFYQTT